MKDLEKEVYRDELCQAVKKEYRLLLSIKMPDWEAETRTVDYCMREYVANSDDEGRMWLALALSQWKLGRLSDMTKEKAFFWIKDDKFAISEYARNKLNEIWQAPMPARKNVPKPSWVARCPWPVGSLLAYRIMSADHPKVTNSPYWKKYVLLRIIEIPGTPVSWLAPEAMQSESMLVGLYNWYGDAIPDAAIAEELEFTPVVVSEPLFPQSTKIASDNAASNLRIETSCCLDWECAKGIDSQKVFTYLGCDSDFSLPSTDYFKTHITQYSIAHSIPFDAMLVNRLSQLENTDRNK